MINHKYKILYFVSTLANCGPTNQLYEIVKSLDYNIFQPIIVTISPEENDSRKQKFQDLGISVVSLNISRNQFIFGHRKKLEAIIFKFSPDIIHSYGFRADVFSNQLKMSIPHCTTLRSFFQEDYPSHYGRLKGNIMLIKHLHVLKKTDSLICCSKTLADKYQPIFGKMLEYINNGVDIDTYFPCKTIDDKYELRRKLDLDCRKHIFLSVGRLIDIKNPVGLIKAFKQSSISDRAILVILGSGPLLKQCKMWADKSIIIKGHVDNAAEYMRACDTYISASITEGFPNSVLEAAASGLNLILSDIDQHKEMFQIPAKDLDYFEPWNQERLSHLLVQYACKENITSNIPITTHIRKSFSSISMSQKYQQKYLQLAQKG